MITSLERIKAALTEHEWTWREVVTDIFVPDPDTRVWGTRQVPGVRVFIEGEYKGSVEFDNKGRYYARNTRGTWPMNRGMSLTALEDHLSKNSPSARKRLHEERTASAKAREEEEERDVAEAWAVINEEVVATQAILYQALRDGVGVTEDQARVIVRMAQEQGNAFISLTGALGRRERVGKGWLPGANSVTGRYVDGVRIDKETTS